MKRSALPLVLGVYGLVRMCLMPSRFACVPEGKGFVARAVVGHDALDGYAQARIVGNGGLEEGDGGSLLLILHDLAEGDAGCIIDADMHIPFAWSLAPGGPDRAAERGV